MPGHSTAFELGQDQTGVEFEGKLLKFHAGAVSGTDGEAGYGRGAIGIDTTNGKLYVNGGTHASSAWKLVTSAS
tara:strand:- start:1263 stop:1484 length:222 start_codon:yes stop_codon:yes gene_type:complete